MAREIANRLSQDEAHDKVCWSWGNGQSHLQTSHHARPSSVELVRQSIRRGSQGLGGAAIQREGEGGAREDEGEGLRREGNRDTKDDRRTKREEKIERSHGIMHRPQKKGRIQRQSSSDAPVREESVM